MGGSSGELWLLAERQIFVYSFERSEEAYETAMQLLWEAARLMEIPVAELAGDGNYRSSHGAVFVSSLSPGDSLFFINP
jgi:hypothetical protein